MQNQKVNTIFEYLEQMFGSEPKAELNFSSDIECLVAVMLSAQCTDKRVNIVTKELFKKYKTVYDYANANLEELEKLIYSTGFYHNKAKNIISMAKAVVLNHSGQIPSTLAELVNLAGVGRKTASVYLVEWLKKPAIPVDTHVMRVSRRLNLSSGNTPAKIEQDLKQLLNKENWCNYHMLLVLFGRYHCTAKKPNCTNCKISQLCLYTKN
ncbi:MAG: endonuclease III [Firmicutes bacterium]|nr:endonuclease III [Bacillota bacterium]